jgi:ABC-type lipoprotein export system ATPase subunit
MSALVVCDGAGRSHGGGRTATIALQPTSCRLEAGARVAIAGPSGSGKSTLLHLMAGLDAPTVGRVTWPAIGDRTALRPGPVAVVFQAPSLLAPLTITENVALPLILAGARDHDAREAAGRALARLGLEGLGERLPEEISGGQAQRVAVARALAGRPRVILADEPTGQLDRANAAAVLGVLLEAADEAGAALAVATHDPDVAGGLAEHWTMRDGRLETREAEWSR